GKPRAVALLDGSAGGIQPLTVAPLCICIVFFPVVFLTGPARFLFIPLAITVVLAMLASYVLSFTVVPAFARQLLKDHEAGHSPGWGARLAGAFDRAFDRFREAYGRMLEAVLQRRKFVLGAFAVLIAITGALVPVVGTDFFPASDVGIIKLHVRAPRGNRLEGTEQIMAAVEDKIRTIIPPAELRTINHTIGVPGGLNLAFVPSDNVSGADGEMLISLNKPHRPSEYYRRLIREQLADEFPGTTIYFHTADIVSQVLTFGLAAPISVPSQ